MFLKYIYNYQINIYIYIHENIQLLHYVRLRIAQKGYDND
jgi:hypothetical protein